MSILQFFKVVLKNSGIALLTTSMVFHFLDHELVGLTQSELFSQDGAGPMLWFYGGLSMLTSLVGPLILISLILKALGDAQSPSTAFTFEKFNFMVREQLRGFGKVFLWGIFLIIPGFYKFLQIVFIPYVVAFDPTYMQGKTDALEKSAATFKARWAKVLGLFFIFALVAPLILTVFDQYRDAREHPIPWAFLVLVDLIVFLLFQCLLLKQWKETHGTDFQLAKH